MINNLFKAYYHLRYVLSTSDLNIHQTFYIFLILRSWRVLVLKKMSWCFYGSPCRIWTYARSQNIVLLQLLKTCHRHLFLTQIYPPCASRRVPRLRCCFCARTYEFTFHKLLPLSLASLDSARSWIINSLHLLKRQHRCLFFNANLPRERAFARRIFLRQKQGLSNPLVEPTKTPTQKSWCFCGSPCRIWTYDPPVNSRMLYRWANEEFKCGGYHISRAVASKVLPA